MDRTDGLLSRVIKNLAPVLAEALAGKADRFLIWIDVEPVDGTCTIKLLPPLAVMQAEIANQLPGGQLARLAACHPALAMPLIATAPEGDPRQMWIALQHRADPVKVVLN